MRVPYDIFMEGLALLVGYLGLIYIYYVHRLGPLPLLPLPLSLCPLGMTAAILFFFFPLMVTGREEGLHLLPFPRIFLLY